MQKTKWKSWHKWTIGIAGAVIILVLLIPGEEKAATSKVSSSATTEKPSPELQLAAMDNIYDSTDIKAIRIKTLVNRLAGTYGESKDSIAEYTYRAQSILKDNGVAKTCLEILETMHKTQKLENTPYKDAITLFVLVNQ